MLAACHQMLTILTGSRRRRPFFAARSRCSLPKYTAGPARPFATLSSSPRLPAGTPAGPSAGRRGRGRANGSDGLPDRYSFALRSRPVCLSPATYRDSTSHKGPRLATILGLECLRQQAVGRSAQAFVNDPV